MNKTVYDLLLKLEQCDDKHNRCDYLMEHDEITYLLEHIEMLEERRKQSIKQKEVLDKIKEYIENNKYKKMGGYGDNEDEDMEMKINGNKIDIIESCKSGRLVEKVKE